MVLGMFWLMHKTIFDSIVAADPPLIWINILFLMANGLVPFSTALVGEYGDLPITAFVYGANVLLGHGLAWSLWLYATHGRRLVKPDLDEVMVRGANRMGLIYLYLMAVLLVLALFAPPAAYVVYGVITGTFILATMVGRWEAVMVWAEEGDEESPHP